MHIKNKFIFSQTLNSAFSSINIHILQALIAVFLIATSQFIQYSKAAETITLFDAYGMALDRDPAYSSARYQYQATREAAPQARAQLLPQINASLTPTRQQGKYADTQTEPVVSSQSQVDRRIEMTQTLFDLSSWYRLKKAKSTVMAGEADFDVAGQSLITRVTEAYFELLTSQEKLSLVEAQIKANEELLAQTKKGLALGQYAITENYEAQSKLDLARARRVALLSEIAINKIKLEKLTGPLTGKQIARVRSNVMPPSPNPRNVEYWAERARRLSPSVLSQIAKLEASRLEIDATKSQHLPVVQLTGDLYRQYSSGSVTSPGQSAYQLKGREIGLKITFPIFSGGGTESKVREAIALTGKTQAELDDARINAEANAREAFEIVETALAQILSLETAIKSGKKLVEANQAGLNLGSKVTYDVLNARQDLYNSYSQLAEARHKALAGLIKLKSSVGDMDINDFKAFNIFLSKTK